MEVYPELRHRATPELSARAPSEAESKPSSQFKAPLPTIAERKQEVASRLDFIAEYRRWGVEFTASQPNAKGWVECRAINREDRDPSANVNVETGDYKSFGEGAEHLSFWDFAQKYGGFPDFMSVLRHYEELAGAAPNGTRKAVKRVPKPLPRRGHSSFEEALRALERSPGLAKQGAQYQEHWAFLNRDWSEHFRIAKFRTSKGKTFRPLYQDPANGWFAMDPPGSLSLFRLPELDQPGRIVFFEGEKCALLGAGLGLNATTSAHGAQAPEKTDLSPCSGRDVAIILDADDAGEAYGKKLIDLLLALEHPPTSIRLVRLPDLEAGEDIEQWLERAPESWDDEICREQIERLIEQAPEMVAPKAPPAPPTAEEMPVFANYHSEEKVNEKGETIRWSVPHYAHQIDADLAAILPDRPKRIGERIFVSDGEPDPKPIYLNPAARFFAHIDARAKVHWTRGPKFIPQERYHQHLTMNLEKFDGIELMPHVPRIDGIYYMHRPLPKPSGKLDQLVDKFCPLTPLDRELVKAMIMTPLWGGQPGNRPAFIITGPDHDPEGRQGRGVGKSKFPDIISNALYGGSLDVTTNDDMGDVKKRLLSPEGIHKRIIRLDNVKTLKFSWAELEDLITSQTISGWVLYQGNGERPNVLTVVITLNGPALSADLSERSVIIKLDRPSKSSPPSWESDVREFAIKYRWEILSEIAELLAANPGSFKPLSRWKDWERDILSKLANPEACQRLILERQTSVNDDASDRETFRNHLYSRIREHGHCPETALVRIHSQVMAQWLTDAMRRHFDTPRSTSFIKGLAIPELQPYRDSHSRGFEWKGSESTEVDPQVIASSSPEPRPSTTTYASGRDRAAY